FSSRVLARSYLLSFPSRRFSGLPSLVSRVWGRPELMMCELGFCCQVHKLPKVYNVRLREEAFVRLRSGGGEGIINQNTPPGQTRSEEHTSELQSLRHIVCRLLLE